jgi:hypothetical protein
VPGDRSHDIPPIPRAWRADKITGSYVIRDANGQALVYIYSRDSEAEALQAKVLTKDEALSAFFVWAIREGIADENPVTGTNKPTEGMRSRESRGFVVSPPPPHAGQALPRRLLPPVRPGVSPANASCTGNLTQPVYRLRAARFLRWRKKYGRKE